MSSFLMVLIFVYIRLISTTFPRRLSSSDSLILSPSLKGRADYRIIPAIALLIVFLDEKPITVPTATLIAPAAAPLIEEN